MLNVTPEIERGLHQLAQRRGVTVESLLKEFVGKELAGHDSPPSAEEQAAAFLAWADSFPDTPPLPDDAISRANLYPDRC